MFVPLKCKHTNICIYNFFYLFLFGNVKHSTSHHSLIISFLHFSFPNKKEEERILYNILNDSFIKYFV